VDVYQEVNMNDRGTSIVGAVHHGTPSSAAPAPSAWMVSAEAASDHPGTTLVDLCSFTCDGASIVQQPVPDTQIPAAAAHSKEAYLSTADGESRNGNASARNARPKHPCRRLETPVNASGRRVQAPGPGFDYKA
jgi:hypothetical protein